MFHLLMKRKYWTPPGVSVACNEHYDVIIRGEKGLWEDFSGWCSLVDKGKPNKLTNQPVLYDINNQ